LSFGSGRKKKIYIGKFAFLFQKKPKVETEITERGLRLRRLKVEAQKPLPIFYKDVMLDCGYRLDLVVEDQVIVRD